MTFQRNITQFAILAIATLAAGAVSFLAPRDVQAQLAVGKVSAQELSGMQLLYAVNDGQYDFEDAYTINNSAMIGAGTFTRVGYFVELTPTVGGPSQWAWASMDTFNTNPTLVGAPRSGSGIVERGTLVTNLNVETSSANVTPVTGADGIIEFWASNYNNNGGGQYGSNDGLFDWKDSNDGTTSFGHGSFQVFAFDDATLTSAETVFGISRNGGSGLGDQPANGPNGNSPDWTFGPGTGTYAIRNLEIYVGTPVPLTAVPEPASVAIWTLLGLLLTGFGYYHNHRRAK